VANNELERSRDYEAAIAAAREKHGYPNIAKSTKVRKSQENKLRRLAKQGGERDEIWTIRCQAGLRERIKELAKNEDSSVSSLMDEAMELLLAAREKQGGAS
jgi:hypothetical protein